MIPSDSESAHGDGLEAARALLDEAEALENSALWAEALERYRLAEARLAQQAVTPERVACEWGMAGVLQQLGHYTEAAVRYRRIAHIHDLIEDDARATESLERLATCVGAMGRRREAIELRLHARERRVEGEEWQTVGRLDLFIGCDLDELGETEAAVPRVRSALRLARLYGSKTDVGWASLVLARLAQQQAGYGAAEQHALVAVASFAEARDDEQVADALVVLGAVRSDMGCNQTSLEAYERALPMFVRAREHLRASWTAEQIGLLLAEDHRHDEAVAFFSFAADEAIAAESPDDAADCWDSGASSLAALGRLDEAEDGHRRALEAYERLGLEDDVAACLTNLAATLQRLGRHDDALQCLERARDHWQRQGDRLEVAQLDVRLGVALDHTGRLEESVARLQSARPVLVEAGWEDAVAHCDQLLERLRG